MAKMVNATFAYKKQGVLITRQIWHLLCLPYVYLSVFIYLQGANVCKSIFLVPFKFTELRSVNFSSKVLTQLTALA